MTAAVSTVRARHITFTPGTPAFYLRFFISPSSATDRREARPVASLWHNLLPRAKRNQLTRRIKIAQRETYGNEYDRALAVEARSLTESGVRDSNATMDNDVFSWIVNRYAGAAMYKLAQVAVSQPGLQK